MSDASMLPKRSWLFSPASQPRRVEKAAASAAHAVIVDLEDAVPEAEKGSARETLRGQLATLDHAALYVRVNALGTAHAFDDVEAVVGPGVAGLVLPKSERARDVQVLAWLLDQMERRRGLEREAVQIIPLIESAAAFTDLAAICKASSRVRRLAFGAADFTFDVGLTWSSDERELMPYRAALVLASRQAGIEAPVDTPWLGIGDRDGMASSAGRSRADGFQGKLCIHPEQVEITNQAYAPTQAQADEAIRIVRAFEAAGSAAIQVDGKMIDYPVVEAARRVLVEAARCSISPAEGDAR